MGIFSRVFNRNRKIELDYRDIEVSKGHEEFMNYWRSTPECMAIAIPENISTLNRNLLVFLPPNCTIQEDLLNELNALTELITDKYEDISQKNGACRYLPATLREKLSFQDDFEIIPKYSPNPFGPNSTGYTYQHFVIGKTLPSGYLIADMTMPSITPNLQMSGFPMGSLYFGLDYEQCTEILERVYQFELN